MQRIKLQGWGPGEEVGGEVTRWREGLKMAQLGKNPRAMSCEQGLQLSVEDDSTLHTK